MEVVPDLDGFLVFVGDVVGLVLVLRLEKEVASCRDGIATSHAAGPRPRFDRKHQVRTEKHNALTRAAIG